ncbi:MAG: aminopeptidase [Sphaerochaetaceae bacterium]|nr:aminopeptidase [Sphaerochaetaceae bacterium]
MELKDSLMIKGAMKLARDCGGVTKDDIVIVCCDYESFQVADMVAKSCLALGACTNMMVFEPTSGHGAPVPEMVGEAMKKATIAFLVTTKSMSHTSAVKSARAEGCRIITMPEVFPHMLMHGAVEADFPERAKVAAKLKAKLTETKIAHIVCSETGTDLTLVLEGRMGRAVDGIAHTPGSFAAPPNIEACIAPVEEKTNGTFVVNASIAGVGVITGEPVKLTIKDGVIVAIEGDKDAETLRSILSKPSNPNCFRIGELGMGLNPCAIPCGSLLEDEAPLGTVHIAAGNNASNFPGGQNAAPVHIDMIAKGATVYLDDTVIIKEGEFQEQNL